MLKTGIMDLKYIALMVDMAMHMMDIVQNSIRAEAKKICISFNEDSIGNRLIFRVEDDGIGMSGEAVKKLADPFYSTRTTRRVGLGVPFLKMTCEQAGGSLEVLSEEGKGTTVEAVYRTDNPDCLPLGDIAGYLALLLKANPGIHFRFAYRVHGKLFEIDSNEMKLQGIDLQYPQMLPAVKEFINENLKELFKMRPLNSFLCR